MNEPALKEQALRVASGPFAGMTLLADVCWGDGDMAPKLLGVYEAELHPVIAKAIGRDRYFLRPIWDARHAVRALPGGRCKLVNISGGRRQAASLMLLDEIEQILDGWSEAKPFAPARLPWQAGVVEASNDRRRV